MNELPVKMWLPSVLGHTPPGQSTCIARNTISGGPQIAIHCTRSAHFLLADVSIFRISSSGRTQR